MKGLYGDSRLSRQFWRRVAIATNGCWIWLGRLRKGYGRFQLSNRKVTAHRFCFETLVKPLGPPPPVGIDLDHTCRIRSCVNPDHLEPVTRLTNLKRSPLRYPTHCPLGHSYIAINTRRTKTGGRACRVCNLIHRLNRRGHQCELSTSVKARLSHGEIVDELITISMSKRFSRKELEELFLSVASSTG